MSEITKLIEQIVKPLIKVQTLKGEVVSVDFETDVCEIKPLTSGANYLDVKLKSVVKNTSTKCVVYPKEGSVVHFAIVNNNDADTYVTQISELDSMKIQVKDLALEIRNSGELKVQAKKIELNGGSLGGMVKAKELKAQIDKNSAVLSSIQNVFQAFVPVTGDGGAALKTAATTFVSMPKADLSNIENKDINHG